MDSTKQTKMDTTTEPEIMGLDDDMDEEVPVYQITLSNDDKIPISLPAVLQESNTSFSGDEKDQQRKEENKVRSTLLFTMVDGDKNTKELPVPGVESKKIMEFIVQYLEHHAKSPVPKNNTNPQLKSNVYSENVEDKWDVTFIEDTVMNGKAIREGKLSNMEKERLGKEAKDNLYELIKAANYMDINSLLMLGSTKVASMVKGRTLENIESSLSPDVPYKHSVASR